MTMIVMLACVVIGIIGVTMVILSALGPGRPSRDHQGDGDEDPAQAQRGPARCCPRCNQFSPAYAVYCAHCGYAFESRG